MNVNQEKVVNTNLITVYIFRPLNRPEISKDQGALIIQVIPDSNRKLSFGNPTGKYIFVEQLNCYKFYNYTLINICSKSKIKII